MKFQVTLAPQDREQLQRRVDDVQHQIHQTAQYVLSKSWNTLILGVYIGVAVGFITALVWFSQPTEGGKRHGVR